MITGVVSADGQPLVTLTVRGPGGEWTFDAQLDTGYDGNLTLPPEVVAHLAHRWARRTETTLADGTEVELDAYLGEVAWDGPFVRVEIDATDVDPLVGLGLLAGHRLTIDFRPGGRVAVTPIPRPPGPASVRGIRV